MKQLIKNHEEQLVELKQRHARLEQEKDGEPHAQLTKLCFVIAAYSAMLLDFVKFMGDGIKTH